MAAVIAPLMTRGDRDRDAPAPRSRPSRSSRRLPRRSPAATRSGGGGTGCAWPARGTRAGSRSAETVATMTPSAVIAACVDGGKGQRGDQRREDRADRDQHHFDLGADDARRRQRRGRDQVGGVFARYRQPGEAAGELARRHHDHGRDQHDRGRAVGKASPQHQGRRHQIEQLHQALRQQPGIAPQQQELLARAAPAAASRREMRSRAVARRAGAWRSP